jgi:hypothetical protein
VGSPVRIDSRNLRSTLEGAKAFLRKHLWARVIVTLLFIASFPLFIIAFILAVIFSGPYDTIKRWANNEPPPPDYGW